MLLSAEQHIDYISTDPHQVTITTQMRRTQGGHHEILVSYLGFRQIMTE